MQNALELNGVVKRYATHLAVDGLTLAIPVGSVYGVLGPNGAGKSTTIRMAMNIVARDAGEVRLLGHDPAERKDVLRAVGYLPEERGLYKKMRVLDVIEFFGRLKGMGRQDARRAGLEWLERMGLSDWRASRVEQLSKGMQQKVQFITTVLHHPALLILDEPGSGLDPVNQEVFRTTITEARDEGRTVILSTHNMKEAEELCDSVCIIAEGKKVLDGSVREIRRAGASNTWRVEFDEPYPEARETLARFAPPDEVTMLPHGWKVTLPEAMDARGLISALATLRTVPTKIERVEPSLHEIFVSRVGGGAARPARRDA